MSGKGAASILPQLFRVGLYKPSQGRLVRQATFIAIAVVAGFGALTLANGPLGSMQTPVQMGVPAALWAACCWLAYRAVNVPKFADFLISVESELEKVVWPGRREVMQATVVVLATMLFLGAFLFAVDFFWKELFSLIRFIEY